MEGDMRLFLTVLCMAIVVTVAHAQSADPPTFSVGDTWTRSNGVTLTVTKIDASGTTIQGFFSACRTCLVLLDKDFQPVDVTDASGKPLDPNTKRGLPLGKDWRFFDWPLQTGKTWTASGYIMSRGGATFPASIDIRVKAYEDVKTKAGTFKAYRMEQAW